MNKYTNKHLNITKEYLLNQYVSNNLNANDIAKRLKCSSTIIYYYLKKCNIKRRSLSESLKGRVGNFGKSNGNYGKKSSDYQKVKCLKKENHPNYSHGKSFKSNYCLDCNKLINWKSTRCQTCSSKLKWKKSNYIKSQMKARGVKQNKAEKLLETIIESVLPNQYDFVGDGELIVGGFCPDFVNKERTKIIEHYGDYWHNREDSKIRDVLRLMAYKTCDYKTLIVWESELKTPTKLTSKIIKFNKE